MICNECDRILVSMPESESNELFNQVQAWIDSAYSQDGDAALTFNEFKNVVRNSIGRIGKLTTIELLLIKLKNLQN